MRRWLYLIADYSYGIEKIEKALKAGVDYMQLREKNITSAEYLKRAKELRRLTTSYGTKLIINDRVDIALMSEADGVHLGQADVPVSEARKLMGEGKIIGATAKTREQAVNAQQEGADYLGSGAWFPTATKEDAVPMAEETYQDILAAISIPDVAVGGITVKNGEKPLRSGAHGLAVCAGILQAEDIDAQVKRFRSILDGISE